MKPNGLIGRRRFISIARVKFFLAKLTLSSFWSGCISTSFEWLPILMAKIQQPHCLSYYTMFSRSIANICNRQQNQCFVNVITQKILKSALELLPESFQVSPFMLYTFHFNPQSYTNRCSLYTVPQFSSVLNGGIRGGLHVCIVSTNS